MPTAFLLAAGFGTRLRPFTAKVPKPLVPVCGVNMLDYVRRHIVMRMDLRTLWSTHITFGAN